MRAPLSFSATLRIWKSRKTRGTFCLAGDPMSCAGLQHRGNPATVLEAHKSVPGGTEVTPKVLFLLITLPLFPKKKGGVGDEERTTKITNTTNSPWKSQAFQQFKHAETTLENSKFSQVRKLVQSTAFKLNFERTWAEKFIRKLRLTTSFIKSTRKLFL